MSTLLKTFAILCLISTYSLANDGVYMSSGGVIYPVQETKISIEKEVLSFKVENEKAIVSISFEFLNPENTTRTLTVGFQAPSPDGDVTDSVANMNQIKDFIVMQNGYILPYKLKVASCEDCELEDYGSQNFSQFNGGIYVYLFEITFEPGINKVNHSYSFPASSNVDFSEIYSYILTTGGKWAGGTIKDFTLNIDFGKNQYFFTKDIFGTNAAWDIIGTGKFVDKTIIRGENRYRMVRILDGYLSIQAENLKPEANISFGVVNSVSFVNREFNMNEILDDVVAQPLDWSLDSTLSKRELRLLRNTVYAQHGYVFHDSELAEYFSQFEWYLPNPNLHQSEIILSEDEEKYIQKIIDLERKN